MCVMLEPFEQMLGVAVVELLSLVREDAGRIRCDVAAAIHRKRIPTLTYRIVPPTQHLEVNDE